MELVREEVRARAQVYTGDALCREKIKTFLKEIAMPNGLLPLKEVEEFGHDRVSGVAWIKQKEGITHKFEEIDKLVSYAKEITGIVETGRIKKLTGVQAREFLIWVTINEIIMEDPPNLGKITFKKPTVSRTFPVSAFTVPEEEEPVKERNSEATEVKEGGAGIKEAVAIKEA